MAQRRTYSRTSGSSSRGGRTTSSYRKPASSSRYQSSPRQKRPAPSGGSKILLIAVLVLVLAGGAAIIIKSLPAATAGVISNNSNAIANGITIDGVDVSGMTKEGAYNALFDMANTKISNISVAFRYKDKSWNFTASELQASVNIEEVVAEAFQVGKTGDSKADRETLEQVQASGMAFTTEMTVDRQVLEDALQDVKSEIDQPMVEASITFDPSGYNYFEDISMPEQDLSKNMFTITPGSVGYAMDYDKAVQELNDALTNGWTADITLEVKEEHPTYTAEELQECTTLIYHSYSKNSHREDTARNHNLAKALAAFKGMVIMPGEMVSYNEVLGERTQRNGWEEANTITAEKTLEKALGGGICQIATTLYNATFRANLKIIDRGPHSWPGYREDFGYGMDAMVNWNTDELIFQNVSDYPVFINTYYDEDAYGRLSYCDIDIYTMPQKDENGNRLYIMPASTIILNEDPPAPEYREDTEGKYAGKTWKYDSTLNKEIFVYRDSKNKIQVSVDKVWYIDAVQSQPGVYAGGVEVKRESDHTDLYNSVQAIIYTRPVAVPTETQSVAPAAS